jgi:hypothetical protein
MGDGREAATEIRGLGRRLRADRKIRELSFFCNTETPLCQVGQPLRSSAGEMQIADYVSEMRGFRWTGGASGEWIVMEPR